LRSARERSERAPQFQRAGRIGQEIPDEIFVYSINRGWIFSESDGAGQDGLRNQGAVPARYAPLAGVGCGGNFLRGRRNMGLL
jgi:hypothetical protein